MSSGTSCRARGGGSFLFQPVMTHGTSSQEEAARLNQWCLRTRSERERERGQLQPPALLQSFPSFLPSFLVPIHLCCACPEVMGGKFGSV